MDVLYPVGAGIDVHRDSLTVCLVRSPANGQRPSYETRVFSCFPQDLQHLDCWLLEQQVPIVAMEGTGIYGMPVYAALEEHRRVLVANAQHVKNVPGRKTDVADSRWLGQLLRCGLLAPSFVPPKDVRDLRALSRERDEGVRQRTPIVLRTHRLLDQHGNKLGSVVSDLQGTTAMEVLRLLAAGETNLVKLSACARTSLKARSQDLRRAMEQPLSEVARGQLQRKLAMYDLLEADIKRVDELLAAHAAPYQAACDKLVEIPGVQRVTAIKIIAELGPDMTAFPSPNHLASWAGVCPGNNESAGKKKSGRTRKGNKYIKTAMVEAAMAAARAKGTYFKSKYHQLRSRRGPKKAAMAVAHKILKVVWHLLSHPEARYQELGEGYLDKQRQAQVEKTLIKRLEALGHEVRLTPKSPELSPS